MPDPAERRRTVLRAPRVDFDLSALALGSVGYLAYQWIWPALAAVLQVQPTTIAPSGGPPATVPAAVGLKWEFFSKVFGFLGIPYGGRIFEFLGVQTGVQAQEGGKSAVYPFPQFLKADVDAWKLVVTGLALLVLWSIVGGAISRVYAVRTARDESIGAGDGLAFSMGNLRSFLQAPLFVIAAAALFFGLASFAAFLGSLPYAGPFLSVVLYPLGLLAALIVTVFLAGLIFGLPILQAALATERNGTLDAISRTFSYIFTRPVAFLVSLVMVVIVVGVIHEFGGMFLSTFLHTLQVGAGSGPSDGSDFRSPGRDALVQGFLAGNQNGLFSLPPLEGVDFFVGAWRVVAWLFTALTLIALNGFTLSYFVGGLTDTYFLLRGEVDGIDESQVFVEEDAASLGEPLQGEPVAAAKEV